MVRNVGLKFENLCFKGGRMMMLLEQGSLIFMDKA